MLYIWWLWQRRATCFSLCLFQHNFTLGHRRNSKSLQCDYKEKINQDTHYDELPALSNIANYIDCMCTNVCVYIMCTWKWFFTQALTRSNALWHTLMRNVKIDPVPLHQSKSFRNVVSFFQSVILLWTLVIQSVLSQKKKGASSFILCRPLFWHSGAPDAAASGHKYWEKKKNPLGHLTAKAGHFQHIIIIQRETVLTVQSHARARSWHIPFLSYRSLVVTG